MAIDGVSALGGALAIAVVGLAAGYLGAAKRLRRDDPPDWLDRALDEGEPALIAWRGEESWSSLGLARLLGAPGRPGLDAIIGRLIDEDGARLADAVAGLRRDRTAFDLTLALREAAGVIAAEGRSALGGRDGAPVALVRLADRTKAEAARRALDAETEAWRNLVDRLPVPAWRRGATGAIVRANVAAAGLALDDGQLAERARRTGSAQTESGYVVIDGRRRLIEFVETPLTDGGTVGIARDVTALVDAQAELARHLADNAEILERMPAAVSIYGPDRRLRFHNAQFARLHGFDRAWLDSEPTIGEVVDWMHAHRRIPDMPDFAAFKREQLRLFTSLIEPREELRQLPDGTTLRLSVGPHPAGGLIYFSEDVTDRLQLERSYNTLIEVQRDTLDNLQEGVVLIGSDGRLKLSNRAFARMWRLDPEQILPEMRLVDLLGMLRPALPTNADWAEMQSRFMDELTSREAAQGRVELADGAVLDYTTQPLPDGALLAAYLDVTSTARVAEALTERNEALEAADRLKSEFLANVSHEMRTPLNAIVGFAELLAGQYFGPLNERQIEYARGIQSASTRIANFFNNLLDLATIEAGHLALEFAPVDVARLFESIGRLVGERARVREIELVIDAPPDVGTVAGDERRLTQALFNLLTNALAFTSQGGVVRLSAHRNPGQVVIEVSDTGIGIATEDQQRVFDLFERGGGGIRRAGAGAGLGLALVRRLVELHGGTVKLDSAVGHGTTVTITLPDQERAA
jgi:signal transduction histidine kinase